MKRSEQDIRFQWDLTKIYPDTAAWEAAMQEAEAALAPLAAIPGTLGTSKEAFKKGLDTIYASMFKVELPYTYAFLKKTEDGSVAENQEMAARSESLLVKFSAATAFLNPEILAIPAEKLDEWMQDEALATYRHTVDDIVRMRAHTLDAAREQMLALLGRVCRRRRRVVGVAVFEHIADAVGQNGGLSGAGAGEHQQGTFDVEYGLPLLGVEPFVGLIQQGAPQRLIIHCPCHPLP